jgi:hypothetical protein
MLWLRVRVLCRRPEVDAVGAARGGVARSPEEGIHAAMIHVTHLRLSRLAIATGTRLILEYQRNIPDQGL